MTIKGDERTSPTAASVAVIGTGPTGISQLKTLLQDGFNATAFERRERVGGLWSYTDDTSMTSALPSTVAKISKFTCGYTDYPMPDKCPTFPGAADFEEFMEGYAEHFGLYEHIVFGASVTKVTRTADGSKWLVDFNRKGLHESREFDKVVMCHGVYTVPTMPTFEGQDQFGGKLMHCQQFRDVEIIKDKKVVIVGVGATACELACVATKYNKRVYMSHRNGAWIIRKAVSGKPTDLLINVARRRTTLVLSRNFPKLATTLAQWGMKFMMRSYGKLDPEWRFPGDAVPMFLHPTPAFDEIIPGLKDGSIRSMHGIKRFTGPKTIEFTDGQVLDDVDVVLCCTGYTSNFELLPDVEMSTPKTDAEGNVYGGPPIARLYKNIFPPAYADSLAILTYSAFGKNNGFSFSDVSSMAISNIWRGVSADMIPSKVEMEREIDKHQQWIAGRWHLLNRTNVSAVNTSDFQGFLHEAAGTGMENLGWGWKGWKFFFQDPKMSWMMNHGVETAHAFRYFETGKRATWSGAREAIIHINQLVQKLHVK